MTEAEEIPESTPHTLQKCIMRAILIQSKWFRPSLISCFSKQRQLQQGRGVHQRAVIGLHDVSCIQLWSIIFSRSKKLLGNEAVADQPCWCVAMMWAWQSSVSVRVTVLIFPTMREAELCHCMLASCIWTRISQEIIGHNMPQHHQCLWACSTSDTAQSATEMRSITPIWAISWRSS